MSAAACPSCSALIPDYGDWPRWCSECDWNVVPPPGRRPEGRLEALYEKLAPRLGDQLVESLVRDDRPRSSWTPHRIGAHGVAALVLVLWLGLLTVGAMLLVRAHDNVFAIVAAAVLVLAAVAMRPRIDAVPTRDIVDPSTAPALHRLIGQVARAAAVRPPDIVCVDHQWNASWEVAGWRGRRVLRLGYPLLTSMAPAERVALVAHELAHDANHDVRDSRVVSSAVGALATLYYFLEPEDDGSQLAWLRGLVFWLVSRPVYGLLALEVMLALRGSQRSEYLADDLAAEVAGTEAVIGAHVLLINGNSFVSVAQRAAAAGGRPAGFFTELRQEIASVPAYERERRSRVARLEAVRLLATHPPTGRRITFLEARPFRRPQVVLSEADSAAIDAELAPQERAIATRIVDGFRDMLYAS